LITSIRKLIAQHFKVAAYASFTGVSAHAISAKTIHSLLGLRKYDSDFKHMIRERKVRPKAIANLEKVDFILIDEVFMTGLGLLGLVDCTLRIVKKSNKPWGGCSVVLTGDALQLPSVADKSLFSPESELDQIDFESQRIIRKFQTFNLSENFRVIDPVYNDSEGCAIQILKKLKAPILKISPIFSKQDIQIKQKFYNIYLYKNAPAVITNNINVLFGLVNGRKCELLYPVYSETCPDYPAFIVVKIQNWPYLELPGGGVPIAREFDNVIDEKTKEWVQVTYFPLRQFLASTLHK
jgi:hypothetical protein